MTWQEHDFGIDKMHGIAMRAALFLIKQNNIGFPTRYLKRTRVDCFHFIYQLGLKVSVKPEPVGGVAAPALGRPLILSFAPLVLSLA